MTTPEPIFKKYAIKRLLAEWRNYELSPSPIKKHINIVPLEENIFEWHGNLAPPTDHPYYSGCIFHFIMHFPDDYPKSPPNIELKNGLAHSNIIPKHYHHGRFYEYFLCMDVINNFFWTKNNGQQLYRGWSSAYSIETLLLQLYTFLFEERVENYDGEIKQTLYQRPPELGGGKYDITKIRANLKNTWWESKNFNCQTCLHSYNKPYPHVHKSEFKDLATINLREPASVLVLSIKQNDYKQSEHKKLFDEIEKTYMSQKPISKLLKLLSQSIWPEIQKQHVESIIKLTFDINKLSKSDIVMASLFNNFKDYYQSLDDQISPIITYDPNKKITVQFDNSVNQILGSCTPPNSNFLEPTLLNKIIGQFFDNGFFLNDILFMYENLIPNKIQYWEELIDFKPKNPNIGRYIILKDIYTPPPITDQKKTRAKYLLARLGQLLTAALLTPHKYILSKWSAAIDELFQILDINTDINREIFDMFEIIKNQRAYKCASGCPYSCKTCYPHGPPVMDNDGDFEIPYAENYNQIRLCMKWLVPELFNLPKLVRPGNLETLRSWYYLWLAKYSELIIDNLVKWGYDFKGRLIQTDNQDLAKAQHYIKVNQVPQIELSLTAKREIFDELTIDGRLLLASISPQFSELLKMPEYKEKTWLKCWITGYTPTQDILGYPIAVTTFTKRGGDSVYIKEITSTLDIMSLTAYSDLKIDKSVWNHEFAFFLPLYLTPAHFKNARPQLMSSLTAIYFIRGLDDKSSKILKPPAAIINDIFATLLNSLVVEMMKGETHISLKALEGFTQLYRTWYYLAESDSDIRQSADLVITDFLTKSQSRHKRVTPNLGKLLMLVCISREYSWAKIQKEYFEESRDRNILWILRACPDIIGLQNWYDIKAYLPNVLDATIVGKRLQIFNKYFTEITKQSGFITSLDNTYGYPDEQMKTDFQFVMQKIYNMKTWSEYYKLAETVVQTESELAHQIYWDIRNSTRKGYNIGIKGIGQVLGHDLELLKLFESNYSLEEIRDFFKKFRTKKIEG